MTGKAAITPHDRFFKVLLDRPDAAGALLRERLPFDIATLLSDEPPTVIPGSFIDPELAEHRTDRLFRASTRAGDPIHIYVLVEHKSDPDPRVGLQLLRYLARAWEAIDRDQEHKGLLPPIVALVVYHGVSPWTASDRFSALVAGPDALRSHGLDFPFTVIDLGRIDDRQLSASRRLRFGLLLLKHAALGTDPREILDEDGVAILRADADFFWAAMHYMLRMMKTPDRAAAVDLARRIRVGEEEAVISKFAEDLLKEGEQRGWLQGLTEGKLEGKREGKLEGRREGKREGLAEGKAESLVRLLERRFGHPVPPDRRAEIRAASATDLDGWLDRLFDAESMEAVFEQPNH